MTWLELKVQTTSTIARELEEVLCEEGALAVTMQDAGDKPIYEPKPGLQSTWDDVVVTGLFDETSNVDKVLLAIKLRFPTLAPSLSKLSEQDWERTWMQDFQPMLFGERLWIIPSHEKVESIHTHQVILDPGLAFGTGKHATTALCLQWLDKNIVGNEIVMDYGCGSGILAIAALKLGAKKSYAIDYDPQAILATEQNAKKNDLSQSEIITLYPEELPLEKMDIILANILANPLLELAEKFADILRPKGKLVLSGILVEQTNVVIETYKRWFTDLTIEKLEEWVRIDGVKM